MSTSKKCSLLLLFALFCLVLPLRAEILVALISDKTLRYFDSGEPGTYFKTVNLTGIPPTESVAALDFRTDGPLKLITREGNTVRFYDVDNTGAATFRTIRQYTFSGATAVAFDTCGPAVRISNYAIVTEGDDMARFGDGGVDANKTLFYDNTNTDGDPVDQHMGEDPFIVALASTNSFTSAQAADLYGIDAVQNSLVKIDWKTGSIDTIATLRNQGGSPLGIVERTGFDISGKTGVAYISFGSGDTFATLLTVDLTTGITTDLGTIGPAFQQSGINVVDITVAPPTTVANLSTRGRVGTDADILIAGFIAQGGQPVKLLIRGIGPSLGAFVPDPLANPILRIFDGNGVQIASNDNWKSDQESDILNTGLAPNHELESAFLGTFAPGQYTAKLSGANGGTGVGVVEVFKLQDFF
ncbi:MAG TPA: DUF4394 domain-containing protein [Chthoniobacterales bacterium]|nr:DUF4394 domain-containing protein [Chthoniobacterales bacterium]